MGKKAKKARKLENLRKRYFEAASAGVQHQARPLRGNASPDLDMEWANTNLTLWGRWLDQNDPLAVGIFDELVTNVVGTGIVIEPKPTPTGNAVNTEMADLLSDIWDEWARAPEVTGEISWSELQRVSCRAWLRDGEFFAQHVDQNAQYPWKPDDIRYRVEYLESDFVPMDVTRAQAGYRQGVYMDAWNRPRGYDVYKRNPFDLVADSIAMAGAQQDLKFVDAEAMLHVKFARRWPQTRGTSIAHAAIRVLQDVKHYESSERVAARVAASMTAFIRKSADLIGQPGYAVPKAEDNLSGERQREFQAGMVWDNLNPGEEIGVVDTNRPNPELVNFRNAMLKSVASATGTRYSAIAKDYNGSYSSQRQEMVESKPHYLRLREYYISRFVRPVYERVITQAWAQNLIPVTSGVRLEDITRAEYIGPGFGWIDPLKEVQAVIAAIDAGLMTREQAIRQLGGDPRLVDMPTRPAAAPVETAPETDDEEEEEDVATEA